METAERFRRRLQRSDADCCDFQFAPRWNVSRSPVTQVEQMKICFVCSEYPPGPHGGIGTMTQVLGRALARRGHEVRVIGVYRRDYPHPDFAEDEGVRVWRLRARTQRFGWPADRWDLFRCLAEWARAREIDLVEVPDWGAWAAGWPRMKIPVVVRVHGSASYWAAELGKATRRRTYWLERLGLKRADFWCAVSRYAGDRTKEVFGLSRRQDATLYNSVFVCSGTSRRKRSRRVVFAGTLNSNKGVTSLIKAWPSVVARCQDAELYVYGRDGKTERGQSMLAHLHSELGNPERLHVHFRGHVSREQVITELSGAAAAVFPSYVEAFAHAPLEAMAAGCPTISSKRGPGPELIREGVDGLLVDPDRPHDIARAIIRVLTDEELSQRLAMNGPERIRSRFSTEVIVQDNERFYENCIQRFSNS